MVGGCPSVTECLSEQQVQTADRREWDVKDRLLHAYMRHHQITVYPNTHGSPQRLVRAGRTKFVAAAPTDVLLSALARADPHTILHGIGLMPIIDIVLQCESYQLACVETATMQSSLRQSLAPHLPVGEWNDADHVHDGGSSQQSDAAGRHDGRQRRAAGGEIVPVQPWRQLALAQ